MRIATRLLGRPLRNVEAGEDRIFHRNTVGANPAPDRLTSTRVVASRCRHFASARGSPAYASRRARAIAAAVSPNRPRAGCPSAGCDGDQEAHPSYAHAAQGAKNPPRPPPPRPEDMAPHRGAPAPAGDQTPPRGDYKTGGGPSTPTCGATPPGGPPPTRRCPGSH